MNVYLIFYITFLEIQLAYSLLYTDTNRKITAVGKFEATIIICLFVTSKDFTNCSSVVILLANNCSKSTIRTLEQPPKDVVLVYLLLLRAGNFPNGIITLYPPVPSRHLLAQSQQWKQHNNM